MPNKLVIVESPTKAKILKKILGREYKVESSAGHIRDLPEKKDHLTEAQKKLSYASLGIDVDNKFKPLYVSSPGKKKTLAKLKKCIEDDTILYLATDEDREGEAIAWHLNDILNPKGKHEAFRVVFHEITPQAIKEAFSKPRQLDMQRVDAQQARRMLDRLVGYKLSPLVWKKIRFGLSAGRVQSAAVRIIVEREKEIEAFKPDEYWTISAAFEKDGIEFNADLSRQGGEKLVPKTEAEAEKVLGAVRDRDFLVAKVESKEVKKNPAAPFITSTLQQEASRKLGFSVKKTMQLAQKLYEGVDLKGEEGATGLITYMRTDSVNLSQLALTETKEALGEFFGSEYQLDKPRLHKTKSKSAQEAHEAIRPTKMSRHPDQVKEHLDPDMLKLYDLIWKRTMATQAPQAIFDSVGVDLEATGYTFRATGQTMKFPGFMKIYIEGSDQQDKLIDSKDKLLPELKETEMITPQKVEGKQHFTKPPARYTEASIVRKMEEAGIGRPSTYAPTISTIISRGYVRLENKALHPTDTARVVDKFLVEHFPDIVNLTFTASMEDDLDKIAEGDKQVIPFLNDFYFPFADRIKEKDKTVKKEDVVSEPTDEKCEECGSDMVIKLGRTGKFLSCSTYPKCKFAKPLGDNTELKELQEKYKDVICPDCESPMAVKTSRFGEFLACTSYPKCKSTLPIIKSSGVACPRCGDDLIEKRGKLGVFWGCQAYPECRYISRYKPVRNGDKEEKGIYVEKKEEEVFVPFDPEVYAKIQERYAKKSAKEKEGVEAETTD